MTRPISSSAIGRLQLKFYYAITYIHLQNLRRIILQQTNVEFSALHYTWIEHDPLLKSSIQQGNVSVLDYTWIEHDSLLKSSMDYFTTK
jgi:hypothetical protein